MSELKYPNTPLQQIKLSIQKRINELELGLRVISYEKDGDEDKIVALEDVLDCIKELEAEDQRQARDAENWSWRNGDDMGR